MSVSIVEAQIIDQPDYETYVECFNDVNDAIEFAKSKVQEELDECEGGTPIVKELNNSYSGNRQIRVDGGEGSTVYYVTVVNPI